MLNQQKDHFPLFSNIKDKKALVIGGGPIAARRLKALTDFSFKITAVAPEFVDEIKELESQSLVSLKKRPFKKSDLNQAFLVLIATDNRQLNREIGLLAKARGAFVSVADAKEECNFYFPGLAHTPDLTVGLVGRGHDHKLVKKAIHLIRDALATANLKGLLK